MFYFNQSFTAETEVNAMEPSFMAKYLPLLCKCFIFLDVHTQQFNSILFILRFFVNCFFLLSTISCLNDSEESQQKYVTKLHDLLFLISALLNEICFYQTKGRMSTIVKLVMERFSDYDKETVHAKTVHKFHEEVAFYCKFVVTFCMGGSLLFYLFSSLILLNTLNEGEGKCIHLPVGWVWNNELYLLLVLLSAVSTYSILSSAFQWYLVMYCMVLKIKCEIRLLCADLDAINGFIAQAEARLEANTSSISRSLEDELSMRIQHASIASCTNENIMKRNENRKAIMDLYFQKYIRERLIEDQVKIYIKSLVEQHLKIIDYSKVTDKTFQLSNLLAVQLGVIVLVFNIPNISLSGQLQEPANMVKIIEVLQILGCIGLFNYVGQIELDESESLRQALYSCDWTDKPRSLRRGLLIMQTVATRPLKLTIGGIYTLSMETYRNILNSTYSYASVIQSLNFE